jgi:hypothetical protein
MLVFPTLDDVARALPGVEPRLIGHDLAYSAMLTRLPHGALGLMLAGLLAAYVSTISTHLNWGSSYLVHDLYRRFVRRGATERHYVLAGRLLTALLVLIASLVSLLLDTASGAFGLLLSIGAGTGLLYLLRWFWWRINAWCEIAAMSSSFLVAAGLLLAQRSGVGLAAHHALLLSVAVTTVVWIAVAFLSPPTDDPKLREFYERVRPAGPGWRRVRAASGLAASPDNLAEALLAWVLGCTAVYAALFGAGSALYGRTGLALVWLVVLAASGAFLWRYLRRSWRGSTNE